MKEAQGELNMTVIVVGIIAVLSFFFFSVLWPNIRGNFEKNTKCDEAICECPGRDSEGNCVVPEDGMVQCYYKDKSGNKQNIMCTWKG